MVPARSMLIAVTSAAAVAFAATQSAVEAAANDTAVLVSRSGSRQAVLHDATNCAGSTLLSVNDFGCGGYCYRVDRDFAYGAHSILLTQEGTDNPKPTADLFYDSNCKYRMVHAGIYKGEHSGCTSWGDASTAGAYSLYLYFDC